MERQVRQLLFCNQFLVALLALLLAVSIVYGFIHSMVDSVEAVKAYRRGDDICFSSTRGNVAITHIKANGIVAALDRPAFIVDSGRGCVNVSEFKNLDWRSDNGDRYPAPPPNAEYVGLYVRVKETVKPTTE